MLIEKKLPENKTDEFISEAQLETIRSLLIEMRNKVVARRESAKLCVEGARYSDDADRAREESAWLLAINKEAWDNNLLRDIENALYKINIGEYGYCERSGEPIEVARLLAYPTSRLTLEEQTYLENRKCMEFHCGVG